MTHLEIERLKELYEEVEDCEKCLRDDEEALHSAQKWVELSKINLANAKRELETFKKTYVEPMERGTLPIV